MRGSPIRTSSDQRSVGSSPRLNAASHVLHRLLVPRHPPCALNNLTTHKTPTPSPPEGNETGGPHKLLLRRVQKMLASTVQFSTTHPPTTHHAPPNPAHEQASGTRTGTAPDETTTPTPHRHNAGHGTGPVPSGPNSAPTTHPPPPTPLHTPPRGGRRTGGRQQPANRTGQRSTLEHHPNDPRPVASDGPSRAGRGCHWTDHPRRPAGCSLERR